MVAVSWAQMEAFKARIAREGVAALDPLTDPAQWAGVWSPAQARAMAEALAALVADWPEADPHYKLGRALVVELKFYAKREQALALSVWVLPLSV